jgi:hypothetical protein
VTSGSNSQRIRAAAALAQYDVANEDWGQECENVATALVSVPLSESNEWIEMLRSVGNFLADPLERRFRVDSQQRSNERPIIAAALSVYLKESPQSLVELMLLADNDREFQPLLTSLRHHAQAVIPELQTLVNQSPPDIAEDGPDSSRKSIQKRLHETEPAQRDMLWKQQANAAVCLLDLGEPASVPAPMPPAKIS